MSLKSISKVEYVENFQADLARLLKKKPEQLGRICKVAGSPPQYSLVDIIVCIAGQPRIEQVGCSKGYCYPVLKTVHKRKSSRTRSDDFCELPISLIMSA